MKYQAEFIKFIFVEEFVVNKFVINESDRAARGVVKWPPLLSAGQVHMITKEEFQAEKTIENRKKYLRWNWDGKQWPVLAGKRINLDLLIL